jgi:integrase
VAQQINRLSSGDVLKLSTAGLHADGGGLYLRISANGGRRWVFVFRWHGKRTEMGLGSARKGHVGLKEARDKASECRRLLRDGISPLEAKRSAPKAVPTFGEFADKLIDDLASGFSNEKHVEQWRSTLKTHAAPLRDKPINKITTEDVLGVLKPIWTTRNETASRLRGRIEKVLSAAKAEGLRDGENPARWRGHLDQRLPKRQKLSRGHHAAMPFAELPSFMTRLRGREAPSARALEFLILTATRGGETRGARWSEFDFDKKVWTIPAERMKSKRPHRVPLTPRMLEILEICRKRCKTAHVFVGPDGERPLSEGAFKVLLDRLDEGEWTPHGFRSSFRDWAAEITSFAHEVVEMALAHVIANDTEAAYRRGDLLEKRRQLMEAWEAYCSPRERTPAEMVAV